MFVHRPFYLNGGASRWKSEQLAVEGAKGLSGQIVNSSGYEHTALGFIDR